MKRQLRGGKVYAAMYTIGYSQLPSVDLIMFFVLGKGQKYNHLSYIAQSTFCLNCSKHKGANECYEECRFCKGGGGTGALPRR